MKIYFVIVVGGFIGSHSDQQRLAISHQKALQAAWPDYYAEHAEAWDKMVRE